MVTYDSMKWYEKVMAHFGAVFGLVMLPISIPICMGIVIWYYTNFGRAIAKCSVKAFMATLRFMFTHNLKRFCAEFEEYEGELWRLL